MMGRMNVADYNIDSDPMTLMANAHRCRELSTNHVLMHSEQWKGMSPKGQEIWDQCSDEDKAVMLSKPATVVTRLNQPSNKHEPSSHKVNVHDTTVYDSIVAKAHLLDYEEATDDAEDDAKDDAIRTEIDKSNDEGDQTLHAFLASRGNNSSPADVRNVLSTSSKRAPSKLPKDHRANAHVTYTVDKCHMDKPRLLIDHGSNGGIAGADICIISSTCRTVNVQGISEHQVTNVKIVTAGGGVQMQKGPVIMIFNQYAHIGTGKNIHSSVQLEEFGLKVNERSVRVPGGLQHIKMPDGYVYPTRIKYGLLYVALRPYTDDEWEMLPHVHWTCNSDWDPAIFNHEFDDNDDEWDDPVMDHRDLLDKVGNYCNRQGVDAGEAHSSRQIEVTISRLHFQARQVRSGEQDWETLRHLFGWAKHYKDAYGLSSWGDTIDKNGGYRADHGGRQV